MTCTIYFLEINFDLSRCSNPLNYVFDQFFCVNSTFFPRSFFLPTKKIFYQSINKIFWIISINLLLKYKAYPRSIK